MLYALCGVGLACICMSMNKMVLERGDGERLIYFAMRSMTMIAGKFHYDDTHRMKMKYERIIEMTVKNIVNLIRERRCSCSCSCIYKK